MKQTILKSVIILISFMSVEITYGQTKEETEKWILEKLFLYGGSDYTTSGIGVGNYKYTNRNYKFDGKYLIISHNAIEGTYKEELKYTFYIPVWAIEVEKTYINDMRELGISLKDYSFVKEETTWKRKTYEWKRERYYETHYGRQIEKWRTIKVPTGYKYESSEREVHYHRIQFISSDPEENFIERFKKAIEHLQTFYPAPEKKKETF